MAGIRIPVAMDTTKAVAGGVLLADALKEIGKFAIEAFQRMQQISPVAEAFDTLAVSIGGAGDAMINELSAATKGLISDFDLMKAANNAIILGVATSQSEFAKLAGAAVKLGRAVGITATQAINSLTTGIGRQSPLVLDNLGVIVKSQQAYDEYAAKIGVATSKLTANQKQLAFNEAAVMAINVAVDRLGVTTLNLSDRFVQLSNAAVNATDKFILAIAESSKLNSALEDLFEGSSDLAKATGDMASAIGQVAANVLADYILVLNQTKIAMVGLAGETEDYANLSLPSIRSGVQAASKIMSTWAMSGGIAALVTAFREAQRVTDETDKKWDALMNRTIFKPQKWQVSIDALTELGDNFIDVGAATADFVVETDVVAISLESARRRVEAIRQPLLLAADAMGTLAEVSGAVADGLSEAEQAAIDFDDALEGFEFLPLPEDVPSVSLWVKFFGEKLPEAVEAGARASLDIIQNVFGVEIPAFAIAGLNAIVAFMKGQWVQAAASAVAAIVGLIKSLITTANAVEHAFEQIGLAISESLGDAIDDLAKQIGDLDTAVRLSLASIIKEVGVTEANFRTLLRAILETLSAVDRGAISASTALDVMGDSILAMIPSLNAIGGSALDFQMIFSDLVTRARMGLLDLDDVIRVATTTLQAMADAGVTGVQDMIDWFLTLGITIDGVAQASDVTWRDLMRTLGIATNDFTTTSEADFIAMLDTLDITAKTREALLSGFMQQQADDRKAAEQQVRRDARETARQLGLNAEETADFVRATIKARRKEERREEKEKRKDARKTARENIQAAADARDGILAEFAGVSITIPIDFSITGGIDNLVALILQRLQALGAL